MPSSGGVRPTLTFDKKSLGRNIETLPAKVDGYIHAVMTYQSVKAVGYMKTTAKWTDRTGNARGGLSTAVVWEPMKLHAIRLFHRVPYGIFLEVRWAGKYAIILPTIRKFGPDTMRLLGKMFKQLGSGGVTK